MIIKRDFFKKVLIGSIFALQLTGTVPVYNALAVGPDIDKTPVEDSIPSNVEVDKETKKLVSEKGKIDREAEKAKRDSEFWEAESIRESAEAKRAEARKKAEETIKAKEKREKDYNDILKKYNKEVDDIDKEYKSNTKRLRKIYFDLTYEHITEEEKQTLLEDLNNITERNEKLYYDVSEILEKLEIVERDEELRKAEKSEETRKTAETNKEYKTENDSYL